MAGNVVAIVGKNYCSSSQVSLIVRRRPHVVNGGGFVVTNCNDQKVVFRVDGCGILGTRGELILRNGDGEALLLIRRKGGIVQALSMHRRWKAFRIDYEGLEKVVFSLDEPTTVSTCMLKNNSIRVILNPRMSSKEKWDFEIKGSFTDKDCSIIDYGGNIVAQVQEGTMSEDVYSVVVQPGYDQAFVLGVIGILDNIHDESTRCS
ncbi:hypothetical protein Syun_026588 [Stephania yunnanensis]|uniref:Protein LURP-one-related 6 n=1 Tax=Stephania yunnanensis TaxID=152371 RepID=A0AAP0EZC8_9MAGN